jgi:hypothetical protein
VEVVLPQEAKKTNIKPIHIKRSFVDMKIPQNIDFQGNKRRGRISSRFARILPAACDLEKEFEMSFSNRPGLNRHTVALVIGAFNWEKTVSFDQVILMVRYILLPMRDGRRLYLLIRLK